jgi:hypothetical protein
MVAWVSPAQKSRTLTTAIGLSPKPALDSSRTEATALRLMKIGSASRVPRSRDLWLRHGQDQKIVIVVLAIFVVLSVRLPHAEPPANADPRMAPFFESLKTKEGGNCCGAADCREVRSESPDNSPTGHWRAFIDRGTFGPTAPNEWIDVPDDTVDGKEATSMRPPGAIACWSKTIYNGDPTNDPPGGKQKRVNCFIVPDPAG